MRTPEQKVIDAALTVAICVPEKGQTLEVRKALRTLRLYLMCGTCCDGGKVHENRPACVCGGVTVHSPTFQAQEHEFING